MLEILFPKKRGCRECFEMKKGVSWQFCCFPKEVRGYDAYFKDGEFVVTNELVTFRALDDNNTIYEVKLSAIKRRKIRFKLAYGKPLFPGSPLKNYEKENQEIDMKSFLKAEPQGRIKICEHHEEKSEDEAAYTETLEMEVDRSCELLRFYLNVIYQPQYAEESQEQSADGQKQSKGKKKVLDDGLTLDYDKNFMEVMKEIMSYCEKRNLALSVQCTEYLWDDFLVPYTEIITDHFELVFWFEKLESVHITGHS